MAKLRTLVRQMIKRDIVGRYCCAIPGIVWSFFNQFTFLTIEQREVLFWNRVPNWAGLRRYLLTGAFIALADLFWLQKMRKGFADVL